MFTVKVYGYENELVIYKRAFKTTAQVTDYGAELCANDEKARCMEVLKDNKVVGGVDFDEQRDKAMLNGHILPVHEKMLTKVGEGEFVKEIHAGRRRW